MRAAPAAAQALPEVLLVSTHCLARPAFHELAYGTRYKFRVREVCADDTGSDPSAYTKSLRTRPIPSNDITYVWGGARTEEGGVFQNAQLP